MLATANAGRCPAADIYAPPPAALNVHEGPQSISSRFYNTQPLLPGMVCSNEPGWVPAQF